MGLLSAGGGDDTLQVKMAVFCIVLSFIVTMLVPILAPAYNSATGYTWDEVYTEKASVEAFTGESMTNLTPWKLTGVYTPWNVSDPVNIDQETGWLYGQSITGYSMDGFYTTTHIGDTTYIYLDPDQKSDRPLSVQNQDVTVEVTQLNWWASTLNGNLSPIGFITTYLDSIFGTSLTVSTSQVDTNANTWTYTGYRYEFDPMLRIDFDSNDKTPDYSTESLTDAKLSIIWYKDYSGQGLYGGLILYNNTSNGLIGKISLDDILRNYNTSSAHTTRYQFDFNGVQIYVNILFDQDVLLNGSDLETAFDDGHWSMAVTAASMDNFLDIKNSNSLSASMGNMLDTYLQIFQLSLPAVPLVWSLVLWIVCILPLEVTMIMFLSRFGLAGVAAGILGNVFLTML